MTQIPIGAVPDITNNQVQVITQAPNLGTEDIEQFRAQVNTITLKLKERKEQLSRSDVQDIVLDEIEKFSGNYASKNRFENLQEQFETYKKEVDEQTNVRETNLKVGDIVSIAIEDLLPRIPY